MRKSFKKTFRKPHPAVMLSFLGACTFCALFWFVQIRMLRQAAQNSSVLVVSDEGGQERAANTIKYSEEESDEEIQSDLITDEESDKESAMLFGDFININKRNAIGQRAADSNLLPIEMVEPNFEVFADANRVKFPPNLSEKVYMDYYISPDKEEDYTDLYYSSIQAKDATSRKSVTIYYSNTHEGVSHFIVEQENALNSRINEVNLVIYQWYNQYFTEFTLGDTIFSVEAKELSQVEFVNVLKSIIR